MIIESGGMIFESIRPETEMAEVLKWRKNSSIVERYWKPFSLG